MGMDWYGYELVWVWTGMGMDWYGYGLVWVWTGQASKGQQATNNKKAAFNTAQ